MKRLVVNENPITKQFHVTLVSEAGGQEAVFFPSQVRFNDRVCELTFKDGSKALYSLTNYDLYYTITKELPSGTAKPQDPA